jgi:O-antigen/teichoic acid export membrane protein
MLKFSIPLVPTAISWWIINISGRTLVSVVLGTSTNAIYAVANKIPNLCQTIFGVFHLSWQESASEAVNDKDRDIYYSNVMNKMIFALASICILILSFNFLFYNFLFTSNYFLGYYHVPILIIAIIFSMISQFIGSIYIAKMESKKNGMTFIIAAIINVVICLSLISFIGLYAATISTSIAYFSLFLIRYHDIRKRVSLSFDRKLITPAIILLYFFICVYINSLILNYINLIFAISYFFYMNRNLIKIKKFYKTVFKNDNK